MISQLQQQPNFKSKGEANCARVFERFVAGYKAVEGQTYEYPIGFHRSVDFKIGSLLVEYHPVDLRHEMLNKQLLSAIKAGLKHCPQRLKRKVYQELHEEYQEQYAKRRKQLISSSADPTARSCELVCCFNKHEVFEKVITRLNPKVTKHEFNLVWGNK